ncbi:PTS transporter subunit EIIA [Enterovirga sp. DB1703]|uniref:PTS transporter subunit EIIA n=2 Tax=Enterovirga aerilata TaxID=2730920 RepID=A0A849IE08_9HYPH|nr:PTS transporter subunit EIIA [Enterovirga sp. DB1703]
MYDFSSSDIRLGVEAQNKHDLLDLLAGEAASRLQLPESEILDALATREELGSTALGKGVALPHAQLQEAERPVVLFARLRRAIEFDARDGEPVDLVVLFLWPKTATKALLGTMAEMCRVLREPTLLRKLRRAERPDEIAKLLNEQLAATALRHEPDEDFPV